MKKRILVVLGHPAGSSFCGALAEAYASAARAAGHDVQVLALADLDFDPIRHGGYAVVQELEPDLVAAQSAITWAQHLVFVYPTWWGTMPALLKGFVERVFLPGFAFKYRKGSALWDRLLTGRSAHLLVTMDSPPWYYHWVCHSPGHNQMKRTVLEFCGIKPVAISTFGSMHGADERKRGKWLAQATASGRVA